MIKKRWFIILIISVFIITAFESCNKHARFKRMLKHRRSVTVKRHSSASQRRFKRKTIPINKNYIIKNRKIYSHN